jgi:initiation factor 1A|tara:strand:+ start:1952 stop:2416 length:465 start_codon:yes stop_codon:yes gene_type:complete
MVKNKTGGNKSKKMGNKYTISSKKTRLPESKDELFAIVTKILGGNQCVVQCEDSLERHCHIRGKFTGKNKHANFVRTGSWVLVGVRSWETTKTIQKSDLLELYGEHDKSYLMDNFDLTTLESIEKKLDGIETVTEDDNIDFTNDEDEVIDLNEI